MVSESRGGAVNKAGETAGRGEAEDGQEGRRETAQLLTQMTRLDWSSSVMLRGKWLFL